MQKSKF